MSTPKLRISDTGQITTPKGRVLSSDELLGMFVETLNLDMKTVLVSIARMKIESFGRNHIENYEGSPIPSLVLSEELERLAQDHILELMGFLYGQGGYAPIAEEEVKERLLMDAKSHPLS